MSQPLVGILGSGKLAEAMVVAALNAGQKPVTDQINRPGAVHVSSRAEVAARCPLLILAEQRPSRLSIRELGDHLKGYHQVVHCVRALEARSGDRLSEVIASETPARQIGALVGPYSSDVILAEKPAGAVVASSYPAVIKSVQKALSSPLLRVYGNTDLLGTEIVSAACAPMTVGIGVGRAMVLGSSLLGLIVARSIAETGAICEAYGGKLQTASGLAGLGYLASDISDDGGPAFLLGKALGTGTKVTELDEEDSALREDLLGTLSSLLQVGGQSRPFHISDATYQILGGELSPQQAAMALLSLEQMME